MITLAIDVGSSSVKTQLFTDAVPVGRIARIAYPTVRQGVKAEVDPAVLLRAVADSIAAATATTAALKPDVVALSVMSPAWLAMDAGGEAITPIVIHQDRRSVDTAHMLESRIGRERHLRLAGNCPFPGSISSTTCAWFLAHEPEVMARADLVGHLNTFLIRRLTGARVIDPSNASFTGLYLTCEQSGWSHELCTNAGVRHALLPEILASDRIAGQVTPQAGEEFHLTPGTPVLAGMIDTSAAMLLTGAAPGQLFHMCGSTDVLAVIAAQAHPHEKLLTRALGIGCKWMSVSTIAAGGASLDWMRQQFFRDLSEDQFQALLSAHVTAGQIRFDPYLAGERASMEQRQAAFSGLTLATTREDMLNAVIDALAAASSARLGLLSQAQNSFLPTVYISGGGACLSALMHTGWPKHWTYLPLDQASLHGLATITPRQGR